MVGRVLVWLQFCLLSPCLFAPEVVFSHQGGDKKGSEPSHKCVCGRNNTLKNSRQKSWLTFWDRIGSLFLLWFSVFPSLTKCFTAIWSGRFTVLLSRGKWALIMKPSTLLWQREAGFWVLLQFQTELWSVLFLQSSADSTKTQQTTVSPRHTSRRDSWLFTFVLKVLK